jgi:hypothetical protein
MGELRVFLQCPDPGDRASAEHYWKFDSRGIGPGRHRLDSAGDQTHREALHDATAFP